MDKIKPRDGLNCIDKSCSCKEVFPKSGLSNHGKSLCLLISPIIGQGLLVHINDVLQQSAKLSCNPLDLMVYE
jgi:hypothetical protein